MPRRTALSCSFCHKSAEDVSRLLGSADGNVHICDECVSVCHDVLEATPKGSADWATRDEAALLAGLKVSSSAVEGTRAVLQQQIDELRKREVSWARIGGALGISRQAAWERFH